MLMEINEEATSGDIFKIRTTKHGGNAHQGGKKGKQRNKKQSKQDPRAASTKPRDKEDSKSEKVTKLKAALEVRVSLGFAAFR
jgi:anti-sigma28 factor (negative regulator of flagellin synthesis)